MQLLHDNKAVFINHNPKEAEKMGSVAVYRLSDNLQVQFRIWYLPSSGKVGGTIVAWDTRVIKVEESLLGEFSVSIKISESREPRLVAIWSL